MIWIDGRGGYAWIGSRNGGDLSVRVQTFVGDGVPTGIVGFVWTRSLYMN
jgi:hypothetical protein